MVNKHGALIRTNDDLPFGAEIVLTLPVGDRTGRARVIWIHPGRERKYGVELEPPWNLWGIHFPPEDW